LCSVIHIIKQCFVWLSRVFCDIRHEI